MAYGKKIVLLDIVIQEKNHLTNGWIQTVIDRHRQTPSDLVRHWLIYKETDGKKYSRKNTNKDN